MITILLLVATGILSIAGIWYIYNKANDEETTKKYLTLFIALIVILSTSFMILDAHTRDIAMGTQNQNDVTLALLLGWTSGGYSPYIKESWGGTGPEQDFDYDGIKNSYDADADNDGVVDAWEYPTRFNPFQPDIGIKQIQVRWDDKDHIRIAATPVIDITGVSFTVTLYVNNELQNTEAYQYGEGFVFSFEVDPDKTNTIELICNGEESEYANKVNNLISYTIAGGVLGTIGQWYYDIENELAGVIRNNPLFQSTNAFSTLENGFRSILATVPFLWIIIPLILIGLYVYINHRRKKKGKPPLFSKWKNKNNHEYRSGDAVIKMY